MIFRTLALSAALVTGLGMASADKAEASPITTVGSHVAIGPLHGWNVGVGIGIPIGGSSGYWTTRQVAVNVPVTVSVQVPDHVIGVDMYGNAVWAYRLEHQTQWQTQWRSERVWVSTGNSRGRLGVGFRFRLH